jgi:hypothetical protein
MFPLFRNFLMFAVVGAIFALSAAAHSPYAEILVGLATIDTNQQIASK